MFKLDNFGVILFVSVSYKKLLQYSFDKNLNAKIEFSAKNSKKLCITTKTCNFKRNFLENCNDSEHAVKTKNARFFMNFPNINKNGNFFPPLNWSFKSCHISYRVISWSPNHSAMKFCSRWLFYNFKGPCMAYAILFNAIWLWKVWKKS
jgi:hypothetical protein